MRQFRDETGVDWKVSLTPRGSDAVSREHYLPEAYRGGWLLFESAQEKRRFAPVPPEWESLSSEALAGLCAKASIQSSRPRGSAESKGESTPASRSVDPLRPQLQKVEQQLDRTLEEVCETPVAARLDTGELIRVEESLALAAEAAKEAVSLRRRMHADRQRDDGGVHDPAPERGKSGGKDDAEGRTR